MERNIELKSVPTTTRKVCLLDADRNQVAVTFKKALLIPSYPQDIFFVKVATTNGATIVLKENINQLRHKNDTKFKIHVHKRLYYLMTAEDRVTQAENENDSALTSITATKQRVMYHEPTGKPRTLQRHATENQISNPLLHYPHARLSTWL